MSSAAPQIGFDRFVELEWAATALRVRAGVSDIAQLTELIDATHSGPAAKKKTRTVLNRLWLDPRSGLADFADRGVHVYRKTPDASISVLTWGMAIATYPFFGRVAEIVGRLTALQGDCGAAEIHRRMAENYGEREGTRRMTNMVLQSQASWGAIDRTRNGKRIVRKPKISVTEAELVSWLVEACVRYAGHPLPLATLGSNPAIYPFDINGKARVALGRTNAIEVRSTGAREEVVDLQSWFDG